MKILLAVDGSPYTKRMLAYLAAHDEWLGARHDYTVVHVVPSVPRRAAAMLDRATLDSYYDDSAECVFKPIRVFFQRRGIEAAFVARNGAAAEALAALAKRGGFDLIMMGSHGHGALARLVLGSVAAKLLAATQVPVLLVR